MKITTLSTVSLLGLASAKIYDVTFPKTITSRQPFNFTLTTGGYIQENHDIAMSVGIHPGAGLEGSLGYTSIGSYWLGPRANIKAPLVYYASLPAGFLPVNGNYTISAVVFEILGMYNSPYLTFHKKNVTVKGF